MLPDTPGDIFPGATTSSQTIDTATKQEEIQPLHVLMGIGILCALFVGSWLFGGFTVNEQNILLTSLKGGNYRLWGTAELLLYNKMTGLIALVFGAGIVIFLTKKDSPGGTANNDLYIRSQMWLMFFGLLNALVFLWTNDLLFHLGIMGIFLFPFNRLTPRTLFITAVIATVIFSAKNYWNYADHRTAQSKYAALVAAEKKISQDSLAAAKKAPGKKVVLKDSLSKQQKDDKAAWEGIAGNQKADTAKKDDAIKDIRSGSYAKVWNFLLPGTQEREAVWFYKKGIWDLAAMLLLGMALYKFNFFSAAFSKATYAGVAVAGIAGGLLLGWFRLQHNHEALAGYEKYVTAHIIPYDLFFPVEKFCLVAGYAGLLMLLILISWLRACWRAVAAVGEMALTNYLIQTIICTLFFTGIGFGYYGRLVQWQLYFFAAEVCLAQIVYSVLWLRHYQYGPAEWLLRCAIRWKWLPNKKQLATIFTEPPIATVS